MALTADRQIKIKQQDDHYGKVDVFPVAASTTLYHNSFVMLNAAGYLIRALAPAPGATLVLSNTCKGMTLEPVDNSAGADGAKTCRVLVEGDIQHDIPSVALTSVGKPVFIADDGTLQLAQAGGRFIGVVTQYLGTNLGRIRIMGQTALQRGDCEIYAISAPISCSVADSQALLIAPEQNPTGLAFRNVFALVTTQSVGGTEDQPVFTLYDTADNSLTFTMTGSNSSPGDAAGDIIQGAAGETIGEGTTGDALTLVTAGRGVYAKLTQAVTGTGAAGAWRVAVACVPIA